MEGTVVESAPRSRIIERPRLTRVLDATNARIILLVAPAGYGKTTLARQWMAAGDRRHGWHACTSASLDVAALSAGIARAAAEVVPGAGRRMLDRLRAEGAPIPSPLDLASLLADDLQDWPDDAWLVVDDYHLAMESDSSEEFVAELLSLAPVRLLATSRERPPWATARRLVYGEILEVRQDDLALTHPEARSLLAPRRPRQIAALMKVAEGWPAVLGLASLTDEDLSSHVAAGSLQEYLAAELLGSLDDEVRDLLSAAALASRPTASTMTHLFGLDPSRPLARLLALGLLARGSDQAFELNPLLRTFLRLQIHSMDPVRRAVLVDNAVSALLGQGQWDDVFAIATEYERGDTIVRLIDTSVDDLLEKGRLDTLERWTARARSMGIGSPVLAYTGAQLAFRRGNYTEARMLAAEAAASSNIRTPRVTQSLLLGGSASYFVNDMVAARDFANQALACGPQERDLWTTFILLSHIAIEDEDLEDVAALLRKLDSLPRFGSVEYELRAIQLRLMSGRWLGFQAVPLPDVSTAEGLLVGVGNPIARTGFLHSLSYHYALAGRYSEARRTVGLLAKETAAYHLAFAQPHTDLCRARIELGLRHFGRAGQLLQRVRDARHSTIHITTNAGIVEARLSLALGRHSEALDQLRDDPPPEADRPSAAEWVGLRALAAACTNDLNEAEKGCRRVLAESRTLEPRLLAMATQALLALKRNSLTESFTARVLSATFSTRTRDPLVTAYRAAPTLVGSLAAPPAWRSQLRNLLIEAGDTRLAHAAGLRLPTGHGRRLSTLTGREAEVLSLVASGLTNRAIAQRLHISEPTVKVHVRHIFDKLGVRTRTEAAIRAMQTGDS